MQIFTNFNEDFMKSRKLIIIAIIFFLPVIFLSKIPKVGATVQQQGVVISSGDVVINEVYYNADSMYEWVELYNNTSNIISINNWTFKDNSSTITISSGNIPANGFLVVAATEKGFKENFTAPANIIFITSGLVTTGKIGNGLANTGDELILKDNLSNVIDQISYGTDTNILNPAIISVAPGHSIERSPAGKDTDTASDFINQTSPTPGSGLAPNNPPTAVAGPDQIGIIGQVLTFDGSLSSDPDNDLLIFSWDFGDGSSLGSGDMPTHSYASIGDYTVTLTVNDGRGGINSDTLKVTINWPPFSNSVKINEFLPNPSGDETTDEFIELYNGSSSAVDLDGWQIKDASGTIFTISKETIGANDFLTFYRSETKITINNDGETLSLLHPNNNITDQVSYTGSAEEGQSYNFDGTDWSWSTTLTPGGENVITLPVEEIKSTSTKKTTSSAKPKASATTAPKDTEEEGSILGGSTYAKGNEIDLPGSQPKAVTKGRTFWEYLAWILLGLSAGSLVGMRFLLWKKNKPNLPSP